MSKSPQNVNQSEDLTVQRSTTSPNNDNRRPRRLNRDFRRRITRPWQAQNLTVSSDQPEEEEEGLSLHSIRLDSDDEFDERTWTFVEGDYYTNQGINTVEEPSQNRNLTDTPNNRDHQSMSAEPTFHFDDPDMEDVGSDSDLEWDRQPFDYAVPFERPILDERYSFETEHPRAAPIIRFAMGMSSADDTGRAVASHARTLQNRVFETYNDASNRAVQMGQQFAETAGRVGGVIADEMLRTGQEVTGIVDGLDRLPDAVRAIGGGWRQAFGAIIRSIATVEPPPEQDSESESDGRW